MEKVKRGLVLAGGVGSRLFPITKACSKQLLALYKKPVIAYPLQTLKSMGYVDILIICADEKQQGQFYELLGAGSRFGLKLSYIVQDKPRGLADAFIVGESFIKDADEICLILGDNIIITDQDLKSEPNTIYTYKVKDPSAYGVAALYPDGDLIGVIEKPDRFIGNDAVIGLYVFDRDCIEIAKNLKPSLRGEIEIADVINKLIEIAGVDVKPLNGFWFDIGDHDSLLDCANLIRTIDKRTNNVIGLENL